MRKTLKNLALIVVLLAVIFYITRRWDVSVISGLAPDWGLIFVSCLILSVHFLLVSLLSYFILTPVTKMPVIKYMEVYFITQMGRYIPGKIWLIMGKIEFLKKEGFSRTWIASTSMLELFLMLVGAGLVSVFGIFQETSTTRFADYRWILLAFVAVSCVFILGVKWVWLVIQRITVFVKKPEVSDKTLPPYSIGYMIPLALGYAISWTLQGVAFALLIRAFFPVYNNFYYFIITYAFSWIVGFLSLFAPGGLGVKESMIILLLNQVMLPTESITVAIIARIWASGIELILAGTMTIKYVVSQKQQRNSSKYTNLL